MTPATIELQNISQPGQKRILVVIRNAGQHGDLLRSLGYKNDCTIANRFEIVCTTPAELDAARNPLKPLVDQGLLVQHKR